jgi:DNA modification methylase
MNDARPDLKSSGKTGSPPRTVAELDADPENRRTHPARNLEMITASLRDVGAARSIVIDEHGRVLAGNGVRAAAEAAGISKLRIVEGEPDELIAVRRRGLTEEQKRALAIYDNRTGELAAWDFEQLAADRVAGLTLDPFWTTDEQAMLFGEGRPGLTDVEVVPELRATSIVPGDLFALGAHRLLCGDSTDVAAVGRLLEPTPVALAFTSPPYADQRVYAGTIAGTPEHLAGFITACAARVRLLVVNLGLVRRGGTMLRYWDAYIAAAEAAGLRLLSWNVWDRGAGGGVGRINAPFPIQHEFLFVFAGETPPVLRKTTRNRSAGMRVSAATSDRQQDGSIHKNGPRAPVMEYARLGTVISLTSDIGRTGPEKDHPARFPVALVSAYIQGTTTAGETVFDPFLGSGSTLIACEQLERAGLGIELEPRYCQMIIDRWEAFTGHHATKVGDAPRASRRHARS